MFIKNYITSVLPLIPSLLMQFALVLGIIAVFIFCFRGKKTVSIVPYIVSMIGMITIAEVIKYRATTIGIVIILALAIPLIQHRLSRKKENNKFTLGFQKSILTTVSHARNQRNTAPFSLISQKKES